MGRFFWLLFVACTGINILCGGGAAAQLQATSAPSTAILPGLRADGSVLLPSGWSLRPAGRQVPMGHFPVNIAVHPSGKWLAVLHAGMSDHEIAIVDAESAKVKSRVVVDQAFYGICFSPDGKTLFASGGEFEVVHRFSVADDGSMGSDTPIRVAPERETLIPGGMCCDASGKTLFVAGTFGHELVIIDLEHKDAAPRRIALGKDTCPYTCLPGSDGKRLFVSLWGQSGVEVIDLADPKAGVVWTCDAHPTEMALSPDGALLYVACANSTRVNVLDAASGKLAETINCALYPDAPPGNTPASLCLSGDGHTLYVANANANNVAVIDVGLAGHARPIGFVPVGWYPTSVRCANDRRRLFVANGRGGGSGANRLGPNPEVPLNPATVQYSGRMFRGTLSVIDLPESAAGLRRLTERAYAACPLKGNDHQEAATTQSADSAAIVVPDRPGGATPIKHCIYIIKENRTYDQILGDMKEGNGEPQLCLFPEAVTPNHHKLARQFVLLDNFYVESEVSAQGHEWSMGALASDFVEKVWPLNYRGNAKEKLGYPSEGAMEPIARPPGGYLWDRAAEAGVSYFSFGEWVKNGKTPEEPGTAATKALEGHFDPGFRGFDLDYPDQKRADRFIQKLGEFDKAGDMPRLIILRLPNDHTSGTTRGKPTPKAYVADNDLALGRVIEAVTRSRFWPDTAVFVVEDDAQNGPDHVDAHRTVAFVISPYVRRGFVDHTMYSTCSMLRTIELILGLSPMTAYDTAAKPMRDSFVAAGTAADLGSFEHETPAVDLNERNASAAWGSDLSSKFDLSREDAADELLLNEVVWRSVRGADSPMPRPVRAAFVRPIIVGENADADDD